jgi:hypothetical protein
MENHEFSPSKTNGYPLKQLEKRKENTPMNLQAKTPKKP